MATKKDNRIKKLKENIALLELLLDAHKEKELYEKCAVLRDRIKEHKEVLESLLD